MTKLSLVIDKNPAPLVADFTFGPAAGKGERTLETRVRVDMYSNIRAIVETADGKLHMATKFVKAAGGCSAPALKDTDAALAEAGKMQIKLLADGGGQREAQLKIRHPQYSGLQLNQATGYYIPAKFLRVIDVQRGGDRVFRMEGGISLSENPNIRFTYAGGSDETLKVVAEDTDGRTFTGSAAPQGLLRPLTLARMDMKKGAASGALFAVGQSLDPPRQKQRISPSTWARFRFWTLATVSRCVHVGHALAAALANGHHRLRLFIFLVRQTPMRSRRSSTRTCRARHAFDRSPACSRRCSRRECWSGNRSPRRGWLRRWSSWRILRR